MLTLNEGAEPHTPRRVTLVIWAGVARLVT